MLHFPNVKKLVLPILLCLAACFTIKPAGTTNNNNAIALKTGAGVLAAALAISSEFRAVVFNAIYESANILGNGIKNYFPRESSLKFPEVPKQSSRHDVCEPKPERPACLDDEILKATAAARKKKES